MSANAVDIPGNLEDCFLSESGYLAALGWLDDDGRDPSRWTLSTEDFRLEIPIDAVFRFSREDVEADCRPGSFDYGFLALTRMPATWPRQQKLEFHVTSRSGEFRAGAVPELIADIKLMDLVVIRVASSQAHRGREAAAHEFLAGTAGEALTSMFQSHVDAHAGANYVERFRPRPVERSFLTVLFGSAEPVLLQPLLFERQGIDFGEWVYVCNSPEDAETALQSAQTTSELYDVAITVVVMSENVGFAAAANAAVANARGRSLYLVSPDVYPLAGHRDALRNALQAGALGDRLWGGRLFGDESRLAQSGLFIERDVFARSGAFSSRPGAGPVRIVKLAELKPFDRGASFDPAQGRKSRLVPAASGKLMAFDRAPFERIGGFSSRYLYYGYEDADLSLRWARDNGPVAVHPGLRMVHLQARRSRASEDPYLSARAINRHLFSLRYNAMFNAQPDAMTATREDE